MRQPIQPATQAPALQVLLIEDNRGDARLVREFLREASGVAVELSHVESLRAGLLRLEESPYDAVFLDLGLPDARGLDALAHVQRVAPDVPVVVLTGHDDDELAAEAVAAGAQDFLVKGVGGGRLLARAIRSAIARQRERSALATAALRDGLTGLPNRVRFGQLLDLHLSAGGAFTLLFADLDGFKSVNDTLGHDAGDALLQAVAGRLCAAVRSSDSVYRLGGDEFTVLLPGLVDAASIDAVCAKLVGSLAEPFALPQGEARIGMSVGVAVVGDGDATSADELVHQADQALYAAKHAGRGTWRVHGESEAAASDVPDAARLRRALADGEFRLHRQPEVCPRTGAVLGVELLLRWQHPSRGLLRPHEFLGALEETGVIDEVGEWVLDEACALASAWRGAWGPTPAVVVNVSPSQLRRPGFLAALAGRLVADGVAPRRLRLDLQESSLPGAPLDVLRGLGELGVGLAVDDFGSTGESLPLLRGLPVDTVKLEPRLIRGIDEDTGGRSEAAALIHLGQQLVGRVAAEHVETAAQLAFLRSHGCDGVSGYLVGAPMAAAEFEHWLGEEAYLGVC